MVIKLTNDFKDFNEALTFSEKEFQKARGRGPETYDEGIFIITTALSLMSISKHKKYGKENIRKFGDKGIYMRAWDKIMRLEQHIFKGVDLGKESALDSWADLAGYSVIGVMTEKGWYELPLAKK